MRLLLDENLPQRLKNLTFLNMKSTQLTTRAGTGRKMEN